MYFCVSSYEPSADLVINVDTSSFFCDFNVAKMDCENIAIEYLREMTGDDKTMGELTSRVELTERAPGYHLIWKEADADNSQRTLILYNVTRSKDGWVQSGEKKIKMVRCFIVTEFSDSPDREIEDEENVKNENVSDSGSYAEYSSSYLDEYSSSYDEEYGNPAN